MATYGHGGAGFAKKIIVVTYLPEMAFLRFRNRLIEG